MHMSILKDCDLLSTRPTFNVLMMECLRRHHGFTILLRNLDLLSALLDTYRRNSMFPCRLIRIASSIRKNLHTLVYIRTYIYR